jgi:multidrug efflux pump subunit AcrA (membrane-fusion protein)
MLAEELLRADATKAQFYIAMETANDVYDQEKAKLEDIQRQRQECKIFAPDDIEEGSMVVYFKNESRRWSNSQEGMIEQGAAVKEGQKMLRIPNLSKMQVNTKIHEAMVGRVRGDVRVPTKLVDFMQFGMLTNTDLMGRALATRPDLIERVRERFRKIDPQFEYKKIADGQEAVLRVESVLNKEFVGHVRSVAAIASQADSWISDTKLFQTFVIIEGEKGPNGTILPLEGELLRPDMTAEVTIHVDGTSGPVLTIPIQSVIGGTEKGATREVFVTSANGYERRQVKLGLYNERMVEIVDGVAEGEQVVVNPKVLLGESKEKTRGPEDLKAGKESRQKRGMTKDGGGDIPAAPGGGFGTDGDPTKGGGKGGFPGGPGGGKFKGKGGKGGIGPPPITE